MKRNMTKTVEKITGHVPTYYDLTREELEELHNILQSHGVDGEFTAFATAFRYGFVLGARAERSGRYEIRA